MAKQHFLIKSEPYKYSFSDLLRDGKTAWDGVRNFEARNTMRSMKRGDLCLFYHSNEGKAVVGIARVAREAYPDPTSQEEWSAVDIEPVKSLARPVTLDEMRGHRVLGRMIIFRKVRLSVVPISKEDFDVTASLGKLGALGKNGPRER